MPRISILFTNMTYHLEVARVKNSCYKQRLSNFSISKKQRNSTPFIRMISGLCTVIASILYADRLD